MAYGTFFYDDGSSLHAQSLLQVRVRLIDALSIRVRPSVQIKIIDVREGASGASADAPGVGLEMVSVLKLIEINENQ